MWEQGEHVAIVGDTGSGKTYLEASLLPMRQYVIVLRTKADDISFSGFRRTRNVSKIDIKASDHISRWLLEPVYDQQQAECRRAIEKVWAEGAWCLGVDELWYAEEKLKLTSGIDRLLTQGRSMKISVVCGMQRPARVSRFALSSCTYLFAFRCEGRDVITLSEAFTPRLKEIIPTLRRYEYVFYNRITGVLKVGTAQTLGRMFNDAATSSHGLRANRGDGNRRSSRVSRISVGRRELVQE
jgi:hypothetical protein